MLKFTFKALCNIEKLSGLSFYDFMKSVESKKSFSDIVIIWQAGRCHEKKLSFDEACEELDNVGLVKASEMIQEAVSAAMNKAGGKTENPPIVK